MLNVDEIDPCLTVKRKMVEGGLVWNGIKKVFSKVESGLRFFRKAVTMLKFFRRQNNLSPIKQADYTFMVLSLRVWNI